MLQQAKSDDYIVATGESHTVREFVEEVFSYLDLDWQKYVEIDPRYFRPSEVDFLQGDERYKYHLGGQDVEVRRLTVRKA